MASQLFPLIPAGALQLQVIDPGLAQFWRDGSVEADVETIRAGRAIDDMLNLVPADLDEARTVEENETTLEFIFFTPAVRANRADAILAEYAVAQQDGEALLADIEETLGLQPEGLDPVGDVPCCPAPAAERFAALTVATQPTAVAQRISSGLLTAPVPEVEAVVAPALDTALREVAPEEPAL